MHKPLLVTIENARKLELARKSRAVLKKNRKDGPSSPVGIFTAAQKIASIKGGKCRSEKFSDRFSSLEWECPDGHRWFAKSISVKNGIWCKECRNNQRLKDAKEIAVAYGGTCLSNGVNACSKLEWKCSLGHVWFATHAQIRSGQWCPDCAGEESLGLTRAKKFAADNGGECLTNKYQGIDEPLHWRCSAKHEWKANYLKVSRRKSGWCRECRKSEDAAARLLTETRPCRLALAGRDLDGLKTQTYTPYSISKLHRIIKSKGGILASRPDMPGFLGYELRVFCQEGHEFRVDVLNIFRGYWCGECEQSELAASGSAGAIQAPGVSMERGGGITSR